jgi:hypothetical protein
LWLELVMRLSHAKAEIARYQTALQERLFEIENKYDAAVLLIAGGAFTLSASIVANFDPPLQSPLSLKGAWIAWGACLVFAAAGHLISASAHRRVIKLLATKNYDINALEGGLLAKVIHPLNVAAFVLLVAGFIAFGKFAFVNLDFGAIHDRQDREAGCPAPATSAGPSPAKQGADPAGEGRSATDNGGEHTAPAAGCAKAEAKTVTPAGTPSDEAK